MYTVTPEYFFVGYSEIYFPVTLFLSCTHLQVTTHGSIWQREEVFFVEFVACVSRLMRIFLCCLERMTERIGIH